jgi:hypothetical protein
MTVEELENNYTYKIIRKVLMREFPWIKDVQVDAPRLKDFRYVIFLDIYIDPYELGKKWGWEVSKWIEGYIERNEPYESTVLSPFFVGSTDDMGIQKGILEKTIKGVQDSPAIPPDMRIPTSEARLIVGSFFTADNITIPEPEPDDIEDNSY